MRRRVAALLVAVSLAAGCSGAPRTQPDPQPATPAEEQPSTQPAESPQTPAPEPPPPPPVQGLIEPAQVLQGDVATLRLDQPVQGNVTVRVTGLSEQPRSFLLDGRSFAFIGIPAAARPGTYPVTVTWADGEWHGNLQVVAKQFTEDRLTVSKEQEDTYYDPRSDAEWRRVFALRSKSNPQPLWQGAFRPPLAGKLVVTTRFGEIRYVNGKETGRHSGMDFAANTGTPILAPAAGHVILAEKLILTGWMVIIDHGVNLFTAYYHCSELLVKPGQSVQAGQPIAKVGSTGFSTGPHLHWTATIGNTPVDPWPFTQRLTVYGS